MIALQQFGKYSRLLLLLVLLLMLVGCGGRKDSQAENGTEAITSSTPVEVAVAERKNLSVAKTYSGTLEGEEQANIVAKLSERITGVNVRVGESVSVGAVTLTLDKSGASSQYYQVEAAFKNAAKTLERMKSLYTEGAVSLQSLDGAQTAYDVAKANFDAAKSAVELTTPIAGVVASVNVSVGDLAVPGAILATIARVNRMKVTFNINETDVANLAIGQKVEVYSETKPETKVEGQISQLSRSADIRSRSFEIKAAFPNTPDRWFRPGMFCKVIVQVSPRTKTLVIPGAAIQSDGIANRVFVVRNGRSYQQSVKVGVSDGQNAEVLEGLQERDTIATVGTNNLRDSSLVTIVNKPQ